MVLGVTRRWFYSDDLEFLIKKVEFFYSLHGVRSAKAEIVCNSTGRVIYD